MRSMIFYWWLTILTGSTGLGFWGISTLYAINQISIGPAIGTATGMSLMLKERYSKGYHVIITSPTPDEVTISMDIISGFFIYNLWELNFEVYGGFGLLGTADRLKVREQYSLRLPIGAVWKSQDIPAEIFGETAFQLGPLPITQTSMATFLGIRARF